MRGREESAVVDFVAILARRFVAVMAVGDEDRLGAHQCGQGRNDRNIGHRPEPMHHAQVIDGLKRRLVGHGLVEQVFGLFFRIGIQAEDRAEVRLAHGHQHEPVELWAGHGFLVRKDLAFAETREPLPGQETAAGVGRAGIGEILVIDVDGRIALGEQHPFASASFSRIVPPGCSGCFARRRRPARCGSDRSSRSCWDASCKAHPEIPDRSRRRAAIPRRSTNRLGQGCNEFHERLEFLA